MQRRNLIGKGAALAAFAALPGASLLAAEAAADAPAPKKKRCKALIPNQTANI